MGTVKEPEIRKSEILDTAEKYAKEERLAKQ